MTDHLRYVTHERADGGWWVTRTPDDPASDTHGLTDGHVRCLLTGVWEATSWDRETVVTHATMDGAVEALLELRYEGDHPDDDGRPVA